MKKLLFKAIVPLVTMLFVAQSFAKILIFTTAYNRPDFIEMQHKTFKKFLKDDYEFVVFNDADNIAKEQAIGEMCGRLGILCVRVPQNLHTNTVAARASFRHGEAVQFAFEYKGFKHDDLVVLIDSDEFLLHDWSIREFLGDADVYVLHDHMKPQLAILNMPQLPEKETLNFRAGRIGNDFIDAGAFTRFYIQAHPELTYKKGTMFWGLYRSFPTDVGIDRNSNFEPYLKQLGYTGAEVSLIRAIANLSKRTNNTSDADVGFYETNLFLDYKHGSDWHFPNLSVKGQKDKLIREFIDSIVA